MLAIADTLGPISSVDLDLPWTDGPATSRRARRALIRRVTTDGAYAGAHADTRRALALGLLILRAQRRARLPGGTVVPGHYTWEMPREQLLARPVGAGVRS